MKNHLFITTFLFLLVSCNRVPEERAETKFNTYAEKFRISDKNSYKFLTIYDPWQRAKGQEINYLLAEEPALVPDSMSNYKRIKIPVTRVAVFSTTHIGFIGALNETAGITGISGLPYICDSALIDRSKNKLVREIGFPPDVNYELLLEMKPDLVFLYGLDPGIAGIAARLEKSGIPVLLIAEYLEPHPLGKMEWIKVFGSVYGKEKLADSIFEAARVQYEQLSEIAGSQENRPSVFTGLPWKDTWYMAGGQSFTSQLIEDAGATYLWEEDTSTDFIPLSLESVLMKTLNADIWINTGTASGLRDIEARDSRFRQIKAFRTGAVYNNDALVSINGGNQFWEKGVVEPQIILKDMIKIFHPELLESHSLVFYRKME